MSANVSDPLLALVRERGLIDDLQLEEVMQENNKSGKAIGQILADSRIVDLDTQLAIIAERSSTRSTTDSPNCVGRVEIRRSICLPPRLMVMRPSCGMRRSEMFRFAMTLRREVTGKARCLGGGDIS